MFKKKLFGCLALVQKTWQCNTWLEVCKNGPRMRVCVWGWGMRMLPYLKGKIKHGWIYATVILTLFRPINQHLPLLVRGGGTSALEWDRFCTGCADIYLQGYMSALYPSSVFSSDFFYEQAIQWTICIVGGPATKWPRLTYKWPQLTYRDL